MSNSLQNALVTQIDFYTRKMLVNNIVKAIHQEWISKFKFNGGKITKRETNELQKRLNALGFSATFEKQYDNCIYCQVFHENMQIEWFNLYYRVNSLENTVTTIDFQLKDFATTIARLEVERQSTEDLSKIEPQATVLKAAIVHLLKEFETESKFSTLTAVTQGEMPTVKLLMRVLYLLS